MSKTNKLIIVALLAATLLLGIGYAAIQNITLNISGTAAADPSQSNFKVMFSGTPEVSDSTYVTAGITDDMNATINVSGLTQKGETVSTTYTVQNASTDLSADLSAAITNSNTEYFTITSELGKTSLTAGEATTVTLIIELIKTPLSESVSSTIGVQLTATPVQPGEEGTTGSGTIVPPEEPESGNGGDNSGNEGTEPDVTSITLEYDGYEVPINTDYEVTAITSPNANSTGTFEFAIIDKDDGAEVEIISERGNKATIRVSDVVRSNLSFTLKVTYMPENGDNIVSVEQEFNIEKPDYMPEPDIPEREPEEDPF